MERVIRTILHEAVQKLRMSAQDSISIVLPNYNHAKYLPRSLGAIQPQLREDDELIIVDDASTDGSRALLTEYAKLHPQTKLLFNERNLGPIPSVMRALETASNPLVAFQSADDMVLPDYLSTARDAMNRFPDAAFFMSDPSLFSVSQPVPKPLPLSLSNGLRYFSPADYVAMSKRRPFNIWGHSSIFRRDCVLKAGGFQPEFLWHADWFLYQVLVLRHGFCYAPVSLAAFWSHDESYSGKAALDKDAKVAVITEMIKTAKLPKYADVWPSLRASSVFASAFPPQYMLRTLLAKPTLIGLATPRWLSIYINMIVRRLLRAFHR